MSATYRWGDEVIEMPRPEVRVPFAEPPIVSQQKLWAWELLSFESALVDVLRGKGPYYLRLAQAHANVIAGKVPRPSLFTQPVGEMQTIGEPEPGLVDLAVLAAESKDKAGMYGYLMEIEDSLREQGLLEAL